MAIVKPSILVSLIVLLCNSILIDSIHCNDDFYKILGVERSSTEKEMKSAYRKLSAKYHPDRNPGNKSAQDMFIKITKAYETLSDPEKRKIYDKSFADYLFR